MSPVDWLNVAVQAPGDAFGLICVFGYCNIKNIMKYYYWIFFIPECVARVPVSLWGSGG